MKNVQTSVQTRDPLAEAVSAVPTVASLSKLVDLIHPENITDYSIWSDI